MTETAPTVRPIGVARNRERDTVTLAFDAHGTTPARQGEFYIRGGVCWPVSIGDRAEGFLCLAGVNIRTGVTYLFEETAFQTIDHVTGHDGLIKVMGVSGWLNMAWQAYGAATFYFKQPAHLHRIWMLNVLRSKMVQPKPSFTEIRWENQDEAMGHIWNGISSERLIRQENGPIDQALQRMATSPGMEVEKIPALHALACLVTGLTRYPWQRDARPYDERPLEMDSAPGWV